MQTRDRFDARTIFITLWVASLLLKVGIAMRMPLFVDEAFYWQEGRHLALAYSDLPGLSAWLIRAGGALFGDGVLGVRALFLLLAAWLPWLVVRIGVREVGEREGWIAGCAALALPLLATLGILALPDVAMTLATLLCLDAMTRLFRQATYADAVQLALGLAIGALSHYRFIAVIGAGCIALLLLPRGRELLRDPRVMVALAFGAAAWLPLLAWNLDNAEAGLRFQLVDRHPWALHADGIQFVPIQMAFATPLLLAALLAGAWIGRRHQNQAVRLLAWSGAIVVAGFFVLGFFADTERVSFHWPLPGYVALLPLLPLALARWPRWLAAATWTVAGVGVAATFAYYAAISVPQLRERAASMKWYPTNFSGWEALAGAVREVRATMPPDTRVVADNFKVGAELGFLLDDPDIPVMEHPLNRAHGRAPQLQLWGLKVGRRSDLGDGPVLLALSSTDVKLSELLDHYHARCRQMGELGAPRIVNVDRGAKRFLLFRLPAVARDGDRDAGPAKNCVVPAIAYLNAPAPGATVPRRFEVGGWAFKDGAGVAGVRITLDGRTVAEADYGAHDAWPQQFYRGRSRDPAHPAIGFRAQVDATAFAPGRYWLGLEVTGKDGSRERFAEQAVVLSADP